jgi:uncharacterized protein (TIGR03089 family)
MATSNPSGTGGDGLSAGGGLKSDGGFADFAALWRARAAQGGPRPFLTFRDEGSGERVELSYATFGNWLAKTANMIQDELMAESGDRIALLAPPHWLTAVWALAPLLTGATVDPWGDPAAAHTLVAGPDEDALAAGRKCGGERLAVSLLPLGRPFAEVPEGYRDFTAEVRAYGDRFAAFDPPGAGTPALVVSGEGGDVGGAGDVTAGQATLGQATVDVVSHAGLVEAAALGARKAGLEPGDRLLVDARADRFSGTDLVDWLYAPLFAGASVVLVRGAADAGIERIADMERVTKRAVLA